jgi:hypothetical protein
VKFRKIALIAAVLLLLVSVASAQESFDFEGTLTFGDDPLQESLPLTLNIYDSGGVLLESFQSNSDEQGRFVFGNVPRSDENLYSVASVWNGVEQSSLPQTLAEFTAPLEFPLYDITDSLADVVADRGNLRIEFDEANSAGVQMLLEVHYANLGEGIVLQADEPQRSFTIELPVGAFGIAPQEAPGGIQRYQSVDRIGELAIPGIMDTQPLVPHWPNVLRASFFVPYEDGAVIDMRFPFAVGDMAIFVREDTVSLISNTHSLSDRQETSSGRVYHVYNQTQPLAPGEPFLFTLSGEPVQTVRPAAGGDSGGSSTLIVLIVGSVLVFGGLMAWLLMTRRSESTPSA